MSENPKLLRFFFVLLAIFTIGRWGLSLGGASYAETHQVFSIVILSLISSAYYGGFARHFQGAPWKTAAALGALIGVTSQIVILLSTAISYAMGMDTFFNSPRALNVEQAVPFGAAMGTRAVGLVINTILNVIAASIGYAIGGVLPKRAGAAS